MTRCLNETTVPLVLIHEAHLGDPSGPLVVGVDGSDNAAAAFRWAHAEARRRGAHLKALYAWQEPMGGGDRSGSSSTTPHSKDAAAETVEKAATTTAGAGRSRWSESRRGRAAPVLIEESASAAMVVVGHRGHRRWGRAALGSVAQQVAHHSRCPVVVVPIPA